MFKREIKPLSEGMADSIAKSINKLQYVEEKASRPADRADGDVKPQDISGEEPVKADASAKKAPARKGDQAQADSMEKVKEEMDPVDKKALKGKHSERKDKDIDNDGDVDKSDEYLHKRRQAITKALESKKPNASVDESAELEGLDEDMSRVGKELEAYARKSGGIDKNDFLKAAMMMKKGQKKQLMKFVDDLDTEPREKILSMMGEEIELDEAKNYEIKDGKIHISKANFRKVHKDYKNATKGKERMMALDPKTGATTSFQVVFTEETIDEAKSDYTINHKTFSSAVQHAAEVAKKRGFEVDDDEWDRKVAMGPRKPGKGKTNRYIIGLMKGGKPTKKNLHMQVYYDEGRYELNMYID